MTAGAAGAYCASLEWAPKSVCPFFGVSFFGGRRVVVSTYF